MRNILSASQVEEVSKDSQKYQELQQILSKYELIVNSAEQAMAKPVDFFRTLK